jgi:hypothetical protein
MTQISRATPFTAPRAASAADKTDDASEAQGADRSAFRSLFHDATRSRARGDGGSDAKRDDAHGAATPATSPDDTTAQAATADDAQTIAAQQAAIAQALALTGTPAAETPATAMTTPAADGKLGDAPMGKAAATTAQAAPPAQTTAAWLLGMPGVTPPAAPVVKAPAAASAKATASTAAAASVASSASTLASRLEAALGHGTTAGHAGKPGHAPTTAATAAATRAADAAAALTAAASTESGSATTALTPLEQSVHDLISEISDDRAAGRGRGKLDTDTDADPTDPSATTDPSAAIDPSLLTAPTATTTAITAPTRIAETNATRAASLAQPAELPNNPSHVHLVLDDGPDRVVMTVAVRGNDIHVALRSSDDATTNALTRNAASLDHAMRARGLQLGQLTTDRDPPREHAQNRPSPDDEPGQSRNPRNAKPDAERFTLEEIR